MPARRRNIVIYNAEYFTLPKNREMKNDWKLNEEDEAELRRTTRGAAFLRMKFPAFWTRAFRLKNNFYRYVFDEAKRHVQLLGEYGEYLNDGRFAEIFHRHCCFCFGTIALNDIGEFYCSKDGAYWVCKQCFDDFADKFEWHAADARDIPSKDFAKLDIAVAKPKNHI